MGRLFRFLRRLFCRHDLRLVEVRGIGVGLYSAEYRCRKCGAARWNHDSSF